MSETRNVEGNLTEQMDIWLKCRDHLSPEVRQRLADAIFDGKEVTRSSLNLKISAIMRELILLNIPPIIEPELRRWVELLANNIYVQHEEQGTKELVGRDLTIHLREIVEKTRPATQFLQEPRAIRPDPVLVGQEQPHLIEARDEPSEE